jgi:glycosyltransferase involved in cell wall biosynthesis
MRSFFKILFIHQNFPGQFKFLAPELVSLGNEVIAMTMQKTDAKNWKGVCILPYSSSRTGTPNVHPWLADFETKTIRGEACYRAALTLQASGFNPDVIIAHHGWGESMFIKEVWPSAKLGIYCEYFYRFRGADVGYDPEFPITEPEDSCRLHLKNLNNLLHLHIADAGISPTYWQASTFPESFRSKITVVHDGIDTQVVTPNTYTCLQFTKASGQTLKLSQQDEVVTFVNRNLEPYRGYHAFMRSLPLILKNRPKAHILIVGGDDVSYGARPTIEKNGGTKWKDIFANEVKPQIPDSDWERIHFMGLVPNQEFLTILQLSKVHVYLTYPFVLSWSLLEAMSAGCAIVASNTNPLHEAIKHNETGMLVDFFNSQALAKEVIQLLENPEERGRLGANARNFAIENYDLKTVCLPKQLQWINSFL